MTRTKKRIAVVGYGNVGRHCLDAVLESPDFELAGVVRREAAPAPAELPGVAFATRVDELGEVDGALLACPTRSVPAVARELLAKGIATCDSFDIHGEPLLALRRELGDVAVSAGTRAVISAGWDPGTDSMIRGILELMAPRGLTYTNFGPGMSMGHTVAAKAIPGVKSALSMTLPAGQGVHRRAVYVELEEGADAAEVEAAILRDAYFAHDETRVRFVDDVAALVDTGHGVVLERKGASGRTHNQQFRWEMRIQNPALTAQVMVSALRAAFRQAPGCYTLLELPIADLLPGDRETWIRKLV
ncbi:diaminopimelate dehydrogenase [Vulgatibacter incomptus]|uniref:Meso-diaminopimelate D-dehydrogenase n=1 Tax=Vulgatibacter incomptus TaxID=1391653 RepID=A0A0K1PEA0_9BACT|nr:diaminopimelate dehydrogenase [Vulgatibacter incomptus]AKU91845.1 Meso-diaminopimelate D-dehydrogenase [Vulgatibacter incomptus]